ncbi:MAG: hypothetical protein GY790_10485 [Bacteroidetes bacterium]|nr:hypothetical protein [Bacteroidota bacterium]
MESFKTKFIEEALEYISQLETGLLKLESSPEDQELIELIFRIMHTLKGNSAMFGFNQIDKFTHQLETIYDLIRSGEMKVSMELVSLTLASVDHIGNLLEDEENLNEDVQNTHRELLQRINQIIEKGNISDATESQDLQAENRLDFSGEGNRTYYIQIQMDQDILSNGTNPLYLLDDFSDLGNCMAFPLLKRLPDLGNLDPEKCYISWEVILFTKQDINAINEVFIFVDDLCTTDIHLLGNTNLLDNQEFRTRVENLFQEEGELGMTKLSQIVSSVDAPEESEIVVANQVVKSNQNKHSIASIRVSSEKLDDLMNLVSELVTNQASLNLYLSRAGTRR